VPRVYFAYHRGDNKWTVDRSIVSERQVDKGKNLYFYFREEDVVSSLTTAITKRNADAVAKTIADADDRAAEEEAEEKKEAKAAAKKGAAADKKTKKRKGKGKGKSSKRATKKSEEYMEEAMQKIKDSLKNESKNTKTPKWKKGDIPKTSAKSQKEMDDLHERAKKSKDSASENIGAKKRQFTGNIKKLAAQATRDANKALKVAMEALAAAKKMMADRDAGLLNAPPADDDGNGDGSDGSDGNDDNDDGNGNGDDLKAGNDGDDHDANHDEL
jgi:hypothetical protein